MAKAREIPVAHTPAGGWHGEMPPPFLGACTEPLTAGVPDMRGTWKAFSVEEGGAPVGETSHVERIEQCGNRVVITAGGVVHDMRADGTLQNGVNDVSARVYAPIQVAATFEGGALVLRPGNLFVAVTRHLEGDVLFWHYGTPPAQRVTRMRRVD